MNENVYRISDDMVYVNGQIIIEEKPGLFVRADRKPIGKKTLNLVVSFISQESRSLNILASKWVKDILSICGIVTERDVNL